MYFNYQSSQPDYAPFSPSVCPGTFQKDAVHWGPIDGSGDGLAVTFKCVKGGDESHLYSFQIKFDSDEAGFWYSDTGTPGGSESDFWSVATHEFGHATGWSPHFVEGSSLCPDGEDQQVMCPELDGGATERRLDTHDKDTFSDAYPAQ